MLWSVALYCIPHPGIRTQEDHGRLKNQAHGPAGMPVGGVTQDVVSVVPQAGDW